MLNPAILNTTTILGFMAVIIAFLFFVGKLQNELNKFIIYLSLLVIAFTIFLYFWTSAYGDIPPFLSKNGVVVVLLCITSFLWILSYRILLKTKSIYDKKKAQKEEFDYTEWSFIKVAQKIALTMFLTGAIIILAITFRELWVR